jgi:hypothetical protein
MTLKFVRFLQEQLQTTIRENIAAIFPDMDIALEWYENRLISNGVSMTALMVTLAEHDLCRGLAGAGL